MTLKAGSWLPGRLVALLLTVAAAVLLGPPAAAAALTSPGRPDPGEPGGRGPCGIERMELPNPHDGTHTVYVFAPTGPGVPGTGGACDDATRPGVFFAHGYSAVVPELYSTLIDQLVSNGHVVVYPAYPLSYNPPVQYRIVDAGFRAGAAASGRVDLANVGFTGHSFGGGMTTRMAQLGARRGWGGESLWLAPMAPHFANEVGAGPIELPDHARALVINFGHDQVLDNRIGIELFQAYDLPDDQRAHLMLRSDFRGGFLDRLHADHLTPISIPIPILAPDNVLDWLGVHRSLDAVSACARTGDLCDEDLSDMGSWSDGRAVRKGVYVRGGQGTPRDIGPVTFQECSFFLNPRDCP